MNKGWGVRAYLPRPLPSAANTPPHRRRGSRRGDGSGSCRLAGGQAQPRQKQFAMFGVSQGQFVRHDQGSDRAQPGNDRARLVDPTHVGVARGERAIWRRVVRVFLNCEEQLRHRILEAAVNEVRRPDLAIKHVEASLRLSPRARVGMAFSLLGSKREESPQREGEPCEPA